MKNETKEKQKSETSKVECKDKKCPFHGKLRLRGRSFIGTIIASDVNKSATIEFIKKHYVQKYERFENRRTRLRVHNPPCINAKKNDKVKVVETRPISKSKHFVIVKNFGKDVLFEQKEESIDDIDEIKKENKKDKEKE
jgi:small subunit ribosomal protein S17